MKTLPINKYNVIGLMSGTSLDGIDVAHCEFNLERNRWSFSIRSAETIKYSSSWKEKLSNAHLLSAEKLTELNFEYGNFSGGVINRFIRKQGIKKVDLISSHGHTVFHQPLRGFTYQLGDGNSIHAVTGKPVAYDFRSLDVALGGQGAPLVPVGDRLLFGNYDACLNLGGIANLSLEKNRKRIAYDICFCNMVLNYLSAKIGKDFDKKGKLAETGKVNTRLLEKTTEIYSRLRKARPSLARENFEKDFLNLLEDNSISVNDYLRTFSESIASEIARAIPHTRKKIKILITGGGAHNDFLVSLIVKELKHRAEVILPDQITIDFKEALVFAFLGVLRMRGEINVLKSVTGASADSCSGVLVGI